MGKEIKWVIDPAHTEIGFKAKHLMITYVKGTFKEFEANVYTQGDEFISADIDIWINPSSVDTGSTDRDNHIKGPDFFDVEHYREISFIAHSTEKSDNNNYKLTGDLIIKGITKRVSFDVEFKGMKKDPWGNDKAGFSVAGKINRKDWGLNWNAVLESGGVLVSDEIIISCEVQLVKSGEVLTETPRNEKKRSAGRQV